MNENQATNATKVTDFDYAFVNKDGSFRQISKANMASVLGALISTSAPSYAVVTKTSSYTATTSDGCVLGNTSGGSFTVNAPSAVDWYDSTNNRSGLFVVKQTSSTGTLTVAASGSQTIDGASTVSLTNRGVVGMISDGANWHIVFNS